jgi:flagellin-like hook-associated protein FlgL
MRIGASINGIERQLLNQLAEIKASNLLHSLRLATGKRVNRPKDDPAAFLHITGLESRRSNINATLASVQNAAGIAAETQLVIDEIRTQLELIRSKLVEDENQSLTSQQRTANQTAIEAALDQINELALTGIGGRTRLDGSTDFRHLGLDSREIRELQVLGLGDNQIQGQVTTRAERGKLTYTGLLGRTSSNANITVTGPDGSATFNILTLTSLSSLATTINNQMHKTGIRASVDPNNSSKLHFHTVEFGSDASVTIQVNSGTFNVTGGSDGTDSGVDAVAEINGETLTGNGNRFSYNRNGLRFELEFEEHFSGRFHTVTIDPEQVNTFQLTPDLERQTLLALRSLRTPQLGRLSGSLDDLYTGGSLAGLNTNTAQAIRVVDEALGQFARVEGQVDGFADQTVEASSNILTALTSAIDETLTVIDGVDEEEEGLLLAKNQQRVDSILASLSLFDQQRASIIDLLKQLAGLS